MPMMSAPYLECPSCFKLVRHGQCKNGSGKPYKHDCDPTKFVERAEASLEYLTTHRPDMTYAIDRVREKLARKKGN